MENYRREEHDNCDGFYITYNHRVGPLTGQQEVDLMALILLLTIHKFWGFWPAIGRDVRILDLKKGGVSNGRWGPRVDKDLLSRNDHDLK